MSQYRCLTPVGLGDGVTLEEGVYPGRSTPVGPGREWHFITLTSAEIVRMGGTVSSREGDDREFSVSEQVKSEYILPVIDS